MTSEEFISSSFPNTSPQATQIWLSASIKKQAAEILNRPYRNLRVRYWSEQRRTAWIFDEIGKELPITIGVVINPNGIESVKVLAFRESRGGEVRYPFFTEQFEGLRLNEKLKLDDHIDGITGATLSVKAVIRASRLALFLHRQSQQGLSDDSAP